MSSDDPLNGATNALVALVVAALVGGHAGVEARCDPSRGHAAPQTRRQPVAHCGALLPATCSCHLHPVPACHCACGQCLSLHLYLCLSLRLSPVCCQQYCPAILYCAVQQQAACH